MTDGPMIYRYEAKGIQKYVLASDRLKEVKGASGLVDDLPKLLEEALRLQMLALQEAAAPGEVVGGELLYGAAGGATVRFARHADALDFRNHWPLVVSRWAPGLTMSQAITPEAEFSSGAASGANLLSRIDNEIRRDRMRSAPDLPEAGPLVHRAPRSGLPAVVVNAQDLEVLAGSKFDRQGETLFDQAAIAGLRFAKHGNPLPSRMDEANSAYHTDPLARRILKPLPGNPPADLPSAFIGDVDDLDSRYVAVVYADGNDLGALIGEIIDRSHVSGGPEAATKAVGAIAKFSKALTAATEAAVRKAIGDVWRQLEGDVWRQLEGGERAGGQFPGRPVVVGGDDMTFIIRADLALDFTQKYLHHFEHETKDITRLRNHLTACAGIAYVHQNYPFHLALDLAESLCDFAKDSTRHSLNGTTPSSLHFHRVTTSFSTHYRDLLGSELRTRSSNKGADSATKHHLTMGPYLLAAVLDGHPTISNLIELCRAISPSDAGDTAAGDGDSAGLGVPKSAITEVVQLMTDGDHEGVGERLKRIREVLTDTTLDPRRERTRGGPSTAESKGQSNWDAFQAALAGMGVDPLTGWAAPTSRRKPPDGQTIEATPLYDALQLLPVSERRKKQ